MDQGRKTWGTSVDYQLTSSWRDSLPKTISNPSRNDVIRTISYPANEDKNKWAEKIPINNKPLMTTGFEDQEDLAEALNEFLTFGQFIGLVPLRGLKKEEPTASLKTSTRGRVISGFIILGLVFNVGIAIIGFGKGRPAKNAGDYAWAPVNCVFYATGAFVYIYFFRYSDILIGVFQKWHTMRLYFTQVDVGLRRDVNLVAGLLMTSAILENAVSHLKLFPLVEQSEASSVSPSRENGNMSAFEIYYIRSHSVWADLIPYHPAMAAFVFVTNKLSLYSWNFMDLTITILARVLYFKFKALYELGEKLLLTNIATYVVLNLDLQKWKNFAQDHETLCGMLQAFEEFLSPLIFVSFAVNIYFICLQMHLGLTPSGKSSSIASVYAIWSFLHLVVRVYLISLSGSRVNEWAHRILDVCRKCPNDAYILEVERSERSVTMSTVGLTGLRCFTITKPLLLEIVGVVFTFEIVLLQAAQTPLEPMGAGSGSAAQCVPVSR